MKHLLIIDDDIELCELLEEYLSAEGFQISKIHDGEEGFKAATEESFDLVILDVMLPGMNGFDVLRNIREKSSVPVIMLTARGEEVDRIVGLEMGADDYLAKPFNARELVARIRAVFRRSQKSDKQPSSGSRKKLIVGDVSLDLNTQEVARGGEKISFTGVEFQLLEMLLESAGSVVERQTLSEKVLGRRLSYDDRSIDVHISNVRRKLGKLVGNTERIRTIRGVGYLYVITESE